MRYAFRTYNIIRHTIVALMLGIALAASDAAEYAKKVTVKREYTYEAGDNDSKNSVRIIASSMLQTILLREVGEYLHAERRVAEAVGVV